MVDEVRRQYRFGDFVYAIFKAKNLNPEEYGALTSRAGVLDYTWTLVDQIAHERYMARMVGRKRGKERKLKEEEGKIREQRGYYNRSRI